MTLAVWFTVWFNGFGYCQTWMKTMLKAPYNVTRYKLNLLERLFIRDYVPEKYYLPAVSTSVKEHTHTGDCQPLVALILTKI
jgi:hypothetical protein